MHSVLTRLGAGLLLLLAAWGSGCKPAAEEAAPPTVSVAPIVRPEAAAALVAAQQALRSGDFTAALALADSAEGLVSTEQAAFLADVSFLRARIHAELNRPDEARAAYERTLSLKPGYRGAWLNLGNMAFRDGQYSEALSAYRREQALHHDPRLLVYMGRAFAELGQVDSARFAYEQALQADPALAEGYVRLGYLYDQSGEHEKALPYARRAFELEPGNPGYRYLLGRLLLQTGKAEEAYGHLSAVAAQRPQDHITRYNLGQALMRLGQADQARHHLAAADSLRQAEVELGKWETMTRLHPDRPAVWATYGYALQRFGRGAEAMRAYKAALHLDPNHTEVHHALANLCLQQGALDEAVGHYEFVLRQDSTRTGAWLNAGIAYARSGRVELARRAWQRVLRYEPGHAQAAAYLAGLAQR